MDIKNNTKNDSIIEDLFKAGAHFGFVKARRHPTAKPFIFGVKNKIEIFDLEKTKDKLEEAKEFVKNIASQNGTILFVGGKNEAREAIKAGAESIDAPFVVGRWIGGTLTNFSEIKKRISKLEDLTNKKEKGELSKYTKRERLMIDRDIDKLNIHFSGLSSMKNLPKALFVIDSKKEHIAVEEANQYGIPVVALTGADCDLSLVEYPIPGNDASVSSIKFFVEQIVKAYKEGKKEVKEEIKKVL